MGPHNYHISKLLFVVLQELGLSLGVLGWVWWFALVYVGGGGDFEAYWVLQELT